MIKKLTEDSQGQLTDRDTIAIAAMQGLLANHQCSPFSFERMSDTITADMAYRYADAMLEARSKNA